MFVFAFLCLLILLDIYLLYLHSCLRSDRGVVEYFASGGGSLIQLATSRPYYDLGLVEVDKY